MVAPNYGYALDPGYKGLLTSAGLCSEGVLRRASLPEDLWSQADVRLTTDQYFSFAHAIQDAADDPLFALRFIDTISAEWFSPPVFAALCSPNLTTAVSRLARFKPLLAPVELEVTSTPTELRVCYEWLDSTMGSPVFLTGSEALFLAKLARMGTRQHIDATTVILREMPPRREAYEAYLGCPITRGDRMSVTFSAEAATRPFLSNNGAMWDIFEPQLRKRLSDLEDAASFEARTRSVLLEALPGGQTSLEAAAKKLAVSTRTLQRRLRDEGTTFKAVVRETRQDLARHYLGHTRLSYAEIGYLLGFQDTSSFFRAFHDWTGTTPDSARQLLQGDGAVGPWFGASGE